MINLREIESAIRDLEQGSATYNNCMKLASLYIVRDHLEQEERSRYANYTNYGYYPLNNRSYYERGGRNSNSSYGYDYGYNRPMSQYEEEDLMIKRDMPGRDWR